MAVARINLLESLTAWKLCQTIEEQSVDTFVHGAPLWTRRTAGIQNPSEQQSANQPLPKNVEKFTSNVVNFNKTCRPS